ncbi:MAG: DUF4231 domain-containing protein [Lachnospiraceae bacterium]|nr:DUF4231 domain-containing protein [Lachnospiraceae bacterium]
MKKFSENEGVNYLFGRTEIREINFLLEEQDKEETEERSKKSPKKLINDRAVSCLKWYIHKACSYRFMFYFCSIIALCAPLISSVIVGYNSSKTCSWSIPSIITAVLGVASSVATGILALYHAQEKWTRYRSASEYLKRELVLYKAGVGKYSDGNAQTLFLETIEEYMVNEHMEWRDNQKSDTSNGG